MRWAQIRKAQLLTWVQKIGKLLLVEETVAVVVSYLEPSLVPLKNLLVAESTVGIVHSRMIWRSGGKQGLATDQQTDKRQIFYN